MIGLKLQNSFRKNSRGARGEIALFRALIRSFDSLGGEALAKEYHGGSFQVSFNEGRGAGRSTPRCELCDVMIITYPKGNPHQARVTFNQAKVSSSKLGCAWSSIKNGPYRFRANLEQWDLLSNRPPIAAVHNTFTPPANLLKNALLPSVGSFGVFYPVATGFEFAYFVADSLTALNNNSSRTGTLQWNTKILSTRNIATHDEVLGACCLESFGNSIESQLVGTPLANLLTGAPEIRVWIAQTLDSLRREHPDSTLPGELLNGLELPSFLNEEIPYQPSKGYAPPRAAVLIRV